MNNELEQKNKIKLNEIEKCETVEIISDCQNKLNYISKVVSVENLIYSDSRLNDLSFKEIKRNLFSKNLIQRGTKTCVFCDKNQELISHLIQIFKSNLNKIFEHYSKIDANLQNKINNSSLKLSKLIYSYKKAKEDASFNNNNNNIKNNKIRQKGKVLSSISFENLDSVTYLYSQKQNDNKLLNKNKYLQKNINEQKNIIDNLTLILRNKNKTIKEMTIFQEKLQKAKLKIIQKFVSLNFDSNSYSRMLQELKENRININALKNNLEQLKAQNCKLINDQEYLSRKKFCQDFSLISQNENRINPNQGNFFMNHSFINNNCLRSMTPTLRNRSL